MIGGGHNGLVAAAYLAKRGARTRRPRGAAQDRRRGRHRWRPWPEAPEFKVTTLSYVMSLMPDTILRDLQLERHGYRSIPVGPYFVPFPDGRCDHAVRRSEGGTTTSSRRSRRRDADASERWEAWIGGLAEVLGPLLMTHATEARLQSRPPICSNSSSLRGGSAGLDVRSSATSRA